MYYFLLLENECFLKYAFKFVHHSSISCYIKLIAANGRSICNKSCQVSITSFRMTFYITACSLLVSYQKGIEYSIYNCVLPQHRACTFQNDPIVCPLTNLCRWQWRQRIRVTVQGKDAFEAPIELHNQQLQYPEYRFIDCINEEHKPATPATPTHIDGATGVTDIPPVPAKPPAPVRILPIKSLNEVFVGESLSSRLVALSP